MIRGDLFAFRPVRWPLLAAGLAMVLGLAMLGGAAWVHKQAGRIATAGSAAPTPAIANQTSPGADLSTGIDAPPAGMYLGDVRALLKLAAEKRLSLTAVDYQSEANRPAGALLKHVVLHAEGEYPGIKAFVAELLRSLPHSQLEEIQIEQSAATQPAPKIQATIKLALVYRMDAGESALKASGTGP